ncbi:MAG: hypothetical protein SFW35_03940 [Chitinophagales bacterium]|nr:hypothetical protein [Chitinophagales bacterium]
MDEKTIIEKVKAVLDILDYELSDEDAAYSVSFQKGRQLRDDSVKDIYLVAYWHGPKEFPDRPRQFAYIDAATLELLYILTPHGFIEADGTYNDPNEW